ncbi:MacA family efflux pump subunit, partial [Pseudomonas syringae]
TLGDDQKRYATLRQIEPAPDSIASDSSSTNTAVYYNALFDVPNPDGKLRINMTAQVYIVLNAAKDAILVPSSALSSSKVVLSANGMASANLQTTSPQTRKLDLNESQKTLLKEGKASLNTVRVY